jgi:hypothetical protein
MEMKTFDCVELQHQGARRIYEQTKQLTIAEELIYWQKRSQELQHLQHKRISQLAVDDMRK